jgi:hypothetical protein
VLRRPRSKPPVRFPRRARRSVERHEEDAEPQFEIFAKIEDGVRGLLGFFSGTVLILARMLARPNRFDEHADERGYLSPRVHPYTLLTLSAFLSTTTLRVLMTLFIVAVSGLFRGCDAETQVPVDTAAITRDALALPKIDDLMLIGIPTVIVVTLLLRATQMLLQRSGAQAARCEAFFNVGLYIVAFQSLWLLVALGIAVSIGIALPKDGRLDPETVAEVVVIVITLLFMIAWPAMMFRKGLRDVLASRPVDRRRRPGAWGLAAGALVLTLLTSWPEVLVAYPMASHQAKALTADRPVLKVALADVADKTDAALRLMLLLSNNSDETLFVFPDHAQIDLPGDDGKAPVQPAYVEDSRDRLIMLAPRESRWLALRVSLASEPDYVGCSWRPLSEDPARGLPDDVFGRLCLATLTASGEHKPVAAYVRADRDTLNRLGRPLPTQPGK